MNCLYSRMILRSQNAISHHLMVKGSWSIALKFHCFHREWYTSSSSLRSTQLCPIFPWSLTHKHQLKKSSFAFSITRNLWHDMAYGREIRRMARMWNGLKLTRILLSIMEALGIVSMTKESTLSRFTQWLIKTHPLSSRSPNICRMTYLRIISKSMSSTWRLCNRRGSFCCRMSISNSLS